MTSIAPSKWSMSVHSHDRLLLKLQLHVGRFYYILSLPIIALYTLILCGCISKSNQIPNIFLAELRDDTAQLRFGYFGICASDSDTNSFKCTSSMIYTQERISTALSASPELVNFVINLQRSISFITPSIASVIFFFGLLNLGVLQILLFKQQRSSSLKNHTMDTHIQNLTLATRVLLWTSTAISLAAAHSMHSIFAALGVTTSSKHASVQGTSIIRGGTMEALLWSTFALSLLFNTIMQLSTTSNLSQKGRKSTFLPFTRTDMEEREHNIRKITNATAQRLAAIGARDPSQQSIATDHSNTPIYAANSRDSPLNPNFQALNSPGLQPPLATLQRRPTNPKTNTNLRPKPSPLSLASPAQLSFVDPSPRQNTGVRYNPSPSPARRVEVRVPTLHESGRVGQISPRLRGILEKSARATSSIYSRAPTSPGAAKNAWL